MDGWILGGGDIAPARRPRFGLIVLPGRKIGKGEEEMKLGGDVSEVHERKKKGKGDQRFGPNLPLDEANFKIAEAGYL
jgi:hypothetical protein